MTNRIQKPCKNCGKMFTPCADCESNKTMFRWRRFACSSTCAKEYFAKIEASRQKRTDNIKPSMANAENVGFGKTKAKDVVSLESAISKKAKKNDLKNEESEQIE